MADTTIRGSTRGVRIAAMVSLALVAASVTACGSTAPAPPTTRVERGQVSTKVSASGALAAVSSQNLGFAQAAQLVEVNVKVGFGKAFEELEGKLLGASVGHLP